MTSEPVEINWTVLRRGTGDQVQQWLDQYVLARSADMEARIKALADEIRASDLVGSEAWSLTQDMADRMLATLFGEVTA